MSLHAHYLAALTRAWAAGDQVPVAPPRGMDREQFLRRFVVEPASTTLGGILHPDALPPGDWERCQRAIGLARQRTTWLLLELERVLPALAEAGCRPVVLKGAPLALALYPRPEDRWFVDLDLLLTRDELDSAYDALTRIGYRFADTTLSASYYESHHFHRILRSPQGIYLEPHWAVTLPASVYSFDLDALRRDTITVPIGQAALMAPSYVDQVLHGVLQSIASGFADLRRFLDLHLLDRQLDDASRQRLADRAVAQNLGTALWLQYRVREELTGAAIPPQVTAACAPTPRVRLLLENLDVPGACLANAVREHAWYEGLLHLLCVPGGSRTAEVRRFLLPDPGGLLAQGLGPRDLRNPLRRARLIAGRVVAGARMAEMCLRARLAPMQWH